MSERIDPREPFIPDFYTDEDWEEYREYIDGDIPLECGELAKTMKQLENAMRTLNRPIRFQGTAEERYKNYHSHHFVDFGDGETRCSHCDCRPSHAAADYPCGADVPRETIILEDNK